MTELSCLTSTDMKPQGLPAGIDGYLKSVEKVADRARQLSEHWQKAVADGTLKIGDDQKDHPDYDKHKEADTRVRKHLDMAKDASEKVVLFRNADLNKFLKGNGNWKDAFGTDPKWKEVKSGNKEVGNWFEMDKEGTLEEIKKAKKVDNAGALKIYEDKWNTIYDGEGYKGHKAAINSAESAQRKFSSMSLDC